MDLEWKNFETAVIAAPASQARGLVCLTPDGPPHEVTAAKRDGTFTLSRGPLTAKASSILRVKR
jgi:hypothetical protein